SEARQVLIFSYTGEPEGSRSGVSASRRTLATRPDPSPIWGVYYKAPLAFFILTTSSGDVVIN
ncbi:MAG: hypothetical protein COZ89_03060, partial [Candidatus Nealsonbacteria bacterium CG_4_8_14_3_um_filter_37_23]